VQRAEAQGRRPLAGRDELDLPVPTRDAGGEGGVGQGRDGGSERGGDRCAMTEEEMVGRATHNMGRGIMEG